MRGNRWAISELRGKNGWIRTVAVPVWITQATDAWQSVAGIEEGTLLRSMSKIGKVEQIKFLLAHSSIQTTVRSLGSEQEIAVAVNDSMGL